MRLRPSKAKPENDPMKNEIPPKVAERSEVKAKPIEFWHQVHGHCNVEDLKKSESVVKGMKITSFEEFDCGTCVIGKMTDTRNRKPDTRASRPLELIQVTWKVQLVLYHLRVLGM